MKLTRPPVYKLPDSAKTPTVDIFAEQSPLQPSMGQFPVTRVGFQDYVTVPLNYIKDLKGNAMTAYFVACGTGCLAIAACIAALTKAPAQIITQEKPVIVTQEKVVPTNCFAFCK